MRDLPISINRRRRRRQLQQQSGQALVESILACSLFMVFLFGLQWLWRYGELRQLNVEAARFAIWERTAYKSTENADYLSLYGSDASLGEKVFRHVFITPRGANQNGGNSTSLMKEHPDWMYSAARFFTSDFDSAKIDEVSKQALTISTVANSSPGINGNFKMGFDPTYNTLTNFKLDTNQYEQVNVSGSIHQHEFITTFMQRIFGIVPTEAKQSDGNDAPSPLGSLTMITNSWSAPGSVAIKRITQELNPLSGTNYVGKVLNSKTVANASQIIGGKAGFGGNYLTDKPGLDATQASNLFSNALNGKFDPVTLKLAKDTNSYKESFSLDGSSVEPDWAGVGCKPNVGGDERRKTYTQDELCPAGIMRSRVIAPFDNPAYRFSTAPGVTADEVRPW